MFLGQACIAQFSEDQNWYRSQIVGLPGHRMVEVQYIDFGNKEVVPYYSLKKPLDKFLATQAMVGYNLGVLRFEY